MSRTKEVQNKALVLEAFDTLFNKRDYVAAVVSPFLWKIWAQLPAALVIR